MSTTKSPSTICLPAHILDANISPRAREVLMLLASQTTPDNPTLWVCHAAIAERLRCSPVTVKRAIQKLVEAKLIVETGALHDRRFKFYRVKWGLQEKLAAPAKTKAPKTDDKVWLPATTQDMPSPGITKNELSSHSGVNRVELLKDSRIAYWSDIFHQKHAENLQQYKMFLLSHPECQTEEDLNHPSRL